MQITWRPTIKQAQAFRYLTDPTTTEILYGGAAQVGVRVFSDAHGSSSPHYSTKAHDTLLAGQY